MEGRIENAGRFPSIPVKKRVRSSVGREKFETEEKTWGCDGVRRC